MSMSWVWRRVLGVGEGPDHNFSLGSGLKIHNVKVSVSIS